MEGVRVLKTGAASGAVKELIWEADVATHTTDGWIIDHS